MPTMLPACPTPAHGRARPVVLAAALIAASSLAWAQAPAERTYVKAAPSVEDLLSRDKNFATLDNASPDGTHVLVPVTSEVSTLARMARPVLRLGMLELDPATDREWHYSTEGTRGYTIFSLATKRSWPITVPADVLLSDARWSPDGRRIAFVVHAANGSFVWDADVATGTARQVSDRRVMSTIAAKQEGPRGDSSGVIQWMPDGSILTLLVPGDRGPVPQAPALPTGPIIKRSRDKATPTPTYPFLLATPHDEALFRYYTTSQLAIVAAGRAPTLLGAPAMHLDIRVSPSGAHVLREQIAEPLSDITGYSSFGRVLDVVDASGRRVAEIRKTPLREGQRRPGGDDDEASPRDVSWRPDGKGLTYLQREPRPARGEEGAAASAPPRKDRVMFVAAPFDVATAVAVVTSDDRIVSHVWSADATTLFTTTTRRPGTAGAGHQDIGVHDLAATPSTRTLLAADIDADNIVALPGAILTRATANGTVSAIVSRDGRSAFLEGDGFKADFRPQPFIDRVALQGGTKTRVFEGSRDMFERPLVVLDADVTRLVISRESATVFPDSYLWTPAGVEKLTSNVDPYPEITGAKRIDFDFVRRDGLEVQARISLPVGYVPGTRVPAMFWTYPSEYTSPKAYERGAIRTRNRNRHTPLSFLRWSDIWLTQGYALVHPDVPIVSENPNDQFVPDAEDTLYAAIRALDAMGYIDVDRVGHGGHSYGAFTTANLLAHTPFFKAGIAGDGAYNRSLTPMGFQGERRSIWEARTTYLEMSPFFYVDRINTPLLMYHGGSDNNTGTFPIQSERLMQALTGLGKTAVLYVYPFESHAPRAREHLSDLWARWLEWFDMYVKHAKGAPAATTAGR